MFLAEVFYIDIQISMHLKLSLDLWAQKSLYKLAAMDHAMSQKLKKLQIKLRYGYCSWDKDQTHSFLNPTPLTVPETH